MTAEMTPAVMMKLTVQLSTLLLEIAQTTVWNRGIQLWCLVYCVTWRTLFVEL